MELGVIEFTLNEKNYTVAVVETEDDIPNDVDYYLYKTDVKSLERGLQKSGRDTIDEKLFRFALEKNIFKQKVKK